MTYEIHEDNMERLTKKLANIRNKCNKLNAEFTFGELGETYKKVKDEMGRIHTARFITVETSGIVHYENWEFIATIEHSSPMNIIRSFRSDVEVPQSYYTADTLCDHCKTKRVRKDTYILRNKETGEFKQVGKSCLKEFTHGLSAEEVARYISWFDEVIKGEAPMGGCKSYDSVKEVVQYAAEAVRMYGFQKADSYGDTTKATVLQQMHHYGDWEKRISDGFNPDHEGNEELAEKALKWISEQEEDYNYISNLKAVCNKEYCESRDYGLIVSLIPAYNRAMDRVVKVQKRIIEEQKSIHVGSVGERITLTNASLKLLTSWDTQFGYTYMYKLTDENGNIFTWKTGKWLSNTDDLPETVTLKGTVKAHSEFRGVKQTELTRCSVA